MKQNRNSKKTIKNTNEIEAICDKKLIDVKERQKDQEAILIAHEKKLSKFKFNFHKLNKDIAKIEELKSHANYRDAAHTARSSTEQICKSLYTFYGCAAGNKGIAPDKLTLSPLLSRLNTVKEIPEMITAHIEAIGRKGNLASHNQQEEIAQASFEPCLKDYELFCNWFISKFKKDSFILKSYKLFRFPALGMIVLFICMSIPAKDCVKLCGHLWHSHKVAKKNNLKVSTDTVNFPLKKDPSEKIKLEQAKKKQHIKEQKQIMSNLNVILSSENPINLEQTQGKLEKLDFIARTSYKNKTWKKWTRYLFSLNFKALNSNQNTKSLANQLRIAKRLLTLNYFSNSDADIINSKINDITDFLIFKKNSYDQKHNFKHPNKALQTLKKARCELENTNNSILIEAETELLRCFLEKDFNLPLLEKLKLLQDTQDIYVKVPILHAHIRKSISNLQTIIEKEKPEIISIVECSPVSNLYYLLKKETNLSSKDIFGNTALHIAVKKDKKDWIKHLIAFGASLNNENNQGLKPIDYCNSIECREFISNIQKEQLSTRYVNIPSGLNIYIKPGNATQKIGFIPFGLPLTLVKSNGIIDQLAGQKGKWVEISFSDKRGWVFDSYLTKGNLLNRSVKFANQINQKGYYVISKNEFDCIETAKENSANLLKNGHPNLIINLKNWKLSNSVKFSVTFGFNENIATSLQQIKKLAVASISTKFVELKIIKSIPKKLIKNSPPKIQHYKRRVLPKAKAKIAINKHFIKTKPNKIKKPEKTRIFPNKRLSKPKKPVYKPVVSRAKPKLDLRGLSELLDSEY